MIVTTPMEHQVKALEVCGYRPFFAYLMEPGLGKTWTVIAEMDYLAGQKLADTIVVICPKSIISVWAEEIEIHSTGHTVHLWNGSGFDRLSKGKGPIWWIINIDAVNRTKTSHTGFDMVEHILDQSDRSAVIVDESTTIKNPDSKRTKSVTTLGKKAKYRRILTGTPVANTPLDIYAQMFFLSPSIFQHSKNFFAFRARYAVMGGYQMRQVVGYKNQEQLAEIVGRHSFRATKAEYLDLPERTTQKRYIELSKETWKAYRALVDEVAIELSDSQMTIDQVVKKITKLRQLTGGWVKDDEGVVHRVCKEKFTELEHLLDECKGQKVIIWCQFIQEILAIQDAYPNFRVYYGAMNDKARTEARHAFEYGDAPGIIIQNDTGSMGLTLNAATVSVFYSNPIYPLPKDQARDRNYRRGQDKPVTEYELIVKGSIDETIYNSWKNKRSLADTLMDVSAGMKSPKAIRDALMFKEKKVDWRSPGKGHDDPGF